ncbi:MAG: hypothetical protein HYU78_11430 [Rhodocyclales bacterium]|nr:hypothetical protein [Rhodocyclales bacterium]
MSVIRALLLLLSAVGTMLFGAALVASLLNPGYVEETAKEVIRRQVEKKVHEKIDALDEKYLSTKAGALINKHAQEAEIAQRQLKEKIPEKIAAVISEMRDLDCECRKKIENHLREGFESQIVIASQAQERLTSFIRTKYMETAEKLTREFRIFTGINALVFSLLGIAVFFKQGAGRHLILPALVLVVASTITGYLYLFNQNWLHTILFSDYVGFAYILYLSMVFAFLCDVSFNRARVTTQLLSSVGGNIQVLPC